MKRILLIILSLFISIEFAWAEGLGYQLNRSRPVSFEGGAGGESGAATFSTSLFADPTIFMSFLNVTEINWDVSKPGTYANEGIGVVVVTTVVPTQITFSGVDDPVEGGGASIPTWYALEKGSIDRLPSDKVIEGEAAVNSLTDEAGNLLTWLTPGELKGSTITIERETPDEQNDPVLTRIYYIWNKIKIDFADTPGTYSDGWTVTVTQTL
ncbi:MAG: hypothetical protein QME81_02735 [bacterium]|nr:hypothetical protein [bacterium]